MGTATGSGSAPQGLEDHLIARELRASQVAAVKAPIRRRKAVLAAVAAGWTPSRIARVMSADRTTVKAILAAADKGDLR